MGDAQEEAHLRAVLERVTALHRPVEIELACVDDDCGEPHRELSDGDLAHLVGGRQVCGTCRDDRGELSPWPCATAVALGLA